VSGPTARNARAEANALLPEGHEARVLEPSPPANTDPDFYADDPTDPSGASGTVVSPTSDGDVTWEAWVQDHPEAAGYAREHWLLPGLSLPDLPDTYTATRKALHQVVNFALAPKRFAVNGKMALRFTTGGFGTPFYGDDEQARIEGDLLVVQRGDDVSAETLTTVTTATKFLGIEYREQWFDGFHDPLAPEDPDTPLDVDPEASRAIGAWCGFATGVLEELRRTEGAEDVGRVQLWPEHFDPAVELGSHDKGHRASYGASPGDDAHDEPYLYVAAWGEIDRANPYWNDEAFNGGGISYAELRASDDPFRTALEFLRTGYRILTTGA
jgi:hypothetical protein